MKPHEYRFPTARGPGCHDILKYRSLYLYVCSLKAAKFLHKLEFGEDGKPKRTVVLKHPILKIMDSRRTAESLRLNTSTMEILVGIRTFMNFCERCTAIGELS
jgi:hypothetical protein